MKQRKLKVVPPLKFCETGKHEYELRGLYRKCDASDPEGCDGPQRIADIRACRICGSLDYHKPVKLRAG
jgi:hypothetical protein